MSNRNRATVEIVNPWPGTPGKVSYSKAMEYSQAGVAYWLRDGKLKMRTYHTNASCRQASDVYVNGNFEIRVAKTRQAIGGPAFPHLQWIHGSYEGVKS